MNNKDKDAINNALIDLRVHSGVAFEALKADDMKALSTLCNEMRNNLAAIHKAMTNMALNALLDNISSLPFDKAWPAMKAAVSENHTIMFHPRMTTWTREHARAIALKLKEEQSNEPKR